MKVIKRFLLLCFLIYTPDIVLSQEDQPINQQINQQNLGDLSYSQQQIFKSGSEFFGSLSNGFAAIIEKIFSRWGRPNAYIIGEEASGSLIFGVRYGEGFIHTLKDKPNKLYWQGPSLGVDTGLNSDKVMMLVYNLPTSQSVYHRFGGVAGSAYFVGGFSFTVLNSRNIFVIPIRFGLGFRLGVNVGYLKVTKEPTWNPF